MPIYEYSCTSCGEGFEKIQKMSDDPLVDCPNCGAPHLKKLVSAPAFRLKGEGWYETDFKSSKKKNLHDSSGAPAQGSTGKSESAPAPTQSGASSSSSKDS